MKIETLMGLLQQETKRGKDVSEEYIKDLIDRDTPMRVTKGDRNGRLYKVAYYCPVCGKQQKDTSKNVKEGCFCERCGQRLEW